MKRIKELTKKDKIKYFVILSLLILLIIGTTYALLKLIGKQEDVNLVETGCFDVTMTNQENAINLDNAFPLTDEQGRTLTPFTFTLKNNCDVTASYNVNLEVLSGSTLSSAYVATLVNNGTINTLGNLPKTDTTIKGSIESRTIYKGILAPGLSVDIGVSIWIDEDVTISDNVANTTLKSKVVVVSTPYLSKGYTGIEGNIVAQLDTTGKCPTVNSDGTVTVTDAETNNGYLCSAPDNYGTSYYYRGNVTNNYVQFGKWADDTPDVVYGFYDSNDPSSSPSFDEYSSMKECKTASYNNNCTLVSRKGKPMYWRIVRINGDGTIRLIYHGTDTRSNGQYSLDSQIQGDLSQIIEDSNLTENTMYDNTYIGYMYGELDKLQESKTSTTDEISTYDQYYLSKEYSYSNDNGFTLKDAVKVSGSEITDKYVGYYIYRYPYEDNAKIWMIGHLTAVDNDSKKMSYTLVYFGTSSKEQAQTNKNDSISKIYLDSWYEANIKGKSFEQYMANSLFCNDRTIDNDANESNGFSNLGYGAELTAYRWFKPFASTFNGEDSAVINEISSKLTCSNQNDAFTVSGTTFGNSALKYPVALMTADEAILAGAYFEKINHNYYLYNGVGNMLMSPMLGAFTVNISYGAPYMTSIDDTGALFAGDWMYSYNVPVINLKQDSLISGTGTIEDPYLVTGEEKHAKANIISYIDNNESNTFPVTYLKDKYTVDKVECDNNVTGTWNTDKWDLDTTNLTQDSTCKVYFTSPEADYASSIQIANKEIKINELNKCPLLGKDGKVKLSSSESENGYVCGAKDNYGVSYYFRGNVTNNYVKFADKYWRILRVNGDGTVRIIYDGTSAHENGESSSDRQVGTSAFNSSSTDNAYVGYMYGKVGATNYADTHTNTNDSTIKTYLDNWYKTNISGTSNEQYIADNIFCNNRVITAGSTGGYGTEATTYSNDEIAGLICSQQNDAFTVSDTTNGNGALTYPVGLLSTDEARFAGLIWATNNYLYSGNEYWTMTANRLSSSTAYENKISSNGSVGSIDVVTTTSIGVRPVLNLKASALNAGTGTASDPFRIE